MFDVIKKINDYRNDIRVWGIVYLKNEIGNPIPLFPYFSKLILPLL